MENLDTGAGETVNRESWMGSACFWTGTSAGRGVTAGSGTTAVTVSEDMRDDFTGMSGKSSSHSNPPPGTDRGREPVS